jgi:hypothetical protein
MMTAAKNEARERVEIDFMFIDLEVCDRCKGTDENLDDALRTVGSMLESAGVQVTVRKTLVDTEAMARELGLVSSPTIRVNGRDIALELRESSCASCGEACGCDGGINCRVWVHRGEEHTVAPVAMIVDAILDAVYGSKASAPAPPASLPENLRRFFNAKAARTNSSCCGPEVQLSCCRPDQKSSCGAPSEDAAQSAGCGCR